MLRAGATWLVAALITHPAAAGMYKCVEDGKTVFQDRPCAGSGSAITVTPANSTVAPENASGKVQPEPRSVTKLRDNVRTLESERKQRELAYAIRDAEREVDAYQAQMDRELAALQQKKILAANNLAGATWEQSISTEMQAVSDKYKTKIQITRDRILHLQKQVTEPAGVK